MFESVDKILQCDHSNGNSLPRGGSRGRVQGVGPPPPPRYYLQLSNTTGVLKKKKKKNWFIGVEVKSKRQVHPLLKEILDPPLLPVCHKVLSLSVQRKSGPIAQG